MILSDRAIPLFKTLRCFHLPQGRENHRLPPHPFPTSSLGQPHGSSPGSPAPNSELLDLLFPLPATLFPADLHMAASCTAFRSLPNNTLSCRTPCVKGNTSTPALPTRLPALSQSRWKAPAVLHSRAQSLPVCSVGKGLRWLHCSSPNFYDGAWRVVGAR